MTLADRRGFDAEVYAPAEDSALLARAAADRLDDADLVLDVGTGSGYVAATVASETGARVLGSDRNPHACRRARENGVEAVLADLVGPFRDGAFDAVVFNPPYLPAVDWEELGVERDAAADEGDGVDERGDGSHGVDWFDVAVTGGETGREVIARFLDDVGRVLAPGGTVLLLASTLTGIDEVVADARDRGFAADTVAEDRFPGERLAVVRLVR